MSDEKLVKLDFAGKNCKITPFESTIPLAAMPGYEKLAVTPSQKGRVSALFQQVPTLMEVGALANSYRIEWPDGLPRELAKFADGSGFMGMSREHGQIEKYAHLYSLNTEAALLAGFSAMSIATGQYFLAEINQQMTMIRQGIDKILEFLYGDKRAELLAEIDFAKYAYQNYASIVDHEEQCIATLVGLQEARKTAIKDIEFYIADLYSTVHGKDESDIEETVRKAFKVRECLELSMQLYMTVNILEAFYSQNFDREYLEYVEENVTTYISKCDMQVLGDFNALRVKIDVAKPKIGGKKIIKEPLLKKVDAVIELLANGKRSAELKANVQRVLYSAEKPSEYCIGKDGSVYLKKE